MAKGLNASPGAAVGEVVFSADAAVEQAAAGRKVILVRWETTPDDLHGMIAAEGILTSHGGKTSHAAVVARGMGKPCVCGAEKLKIDAGKREAVISGTEVVLKEGDLISIDGTTGIVVLGKVELVEPEVSGDFDTILAWADGFRRMGVRANADTPDDAELGRKFGAEGIGLCRTEHMFLGDRKQIVQDMILAEDDSARDAALAQAARRPDEGLPGHLRGDGRAAGHGSAARPAAARVPRQPSRARDRDRARRMRGCARGRARRKATAARADRRHGRGQPHARPARLPARHHVPGDLRHAGARHHARRVRTARSRARPPAGDHDSAREREGRARDAARGVGGDHRRGAGRLWSRPRRSRSAR